MSHPKNRLEDLKAAARKSLSQNFLVSPHWAELLAATAAEAPKATDVWEIGPGLGALTAILVKKTSLPVTLFEFDRKLAENLRVEYPSTTLIEGDVLKADFGSLSQGKSISLLSNLPYHLSSPILFKIMEYRDRFVRLVVTFQREFAERLLAAPRTSDYGSLSVLAQVTFKMKSLGIIPPGAFYPKPGVDSMAVQFEPLGELSLPYENISRVVKTAFMHRRKKVASNLKISYSNEQVQESLNRLGISAMARPEEISPVGYVSLAQLLQEASGK